MIQNYIDAMLKQDNIALAECFYSNARLFDYCPGENNMQNFHVCGKTAIEMFFLNKFFFNIIKISDPVITDEKTADYFVSYGGQYRHVQARIEAVVDDKIAVLVVRPL